MMTEAFTWSVISHFSLPYIENVPRPALKLCNWSKTIRQSLFGYFKNTFFGLKATMDPCGMYCPGSLVTSRQPSRRTLAWTICSWTTSSGTPSTTARWCTCVVMPDCLPGWLETGSQPGSVAGSAHSLLLHSSVLLRRLQVGLRLLTSPPLVTGARSFPPTSSRPSETTSEPTPTNCSRSQVAGGVFVYCLWISRLLFASLGRWRVSLF